MRASSGSAFTRRSGTTTSAHSGARHWRPRPTQIRSARECLGGHGEGRGTATPGGRCCRGNRYNHYYHYYYNYSSYSYNSYYYYDYYHY